MISRRTLLSLLFCAAFPHRVGAADGGAADKARLYLFNIPTKPLRDALITYVEIVGSQIIYDSKLARDMRSKPVVGLFTADTALRLLIAGTPFTVVTTGQDVALMPISEIRAGRWPGQGSDGEVTLVLDTLYVAVPPGAEQRADFSDYGQLVRTRIRQALTDDLHTARRIYDARFDIRIDSNGAVDSAQVTRSSGVPALDAVLRAVIERVTVNRRPPQGMPQPIRITVIGI